MPEEHCEPDAQTVSRMGPVHPPSLALNAALSLLTMNQYHFAGAAIATPEAIVLVPTSIGQLERNCGAAVCFSIAYPQLI